MFRFGASWSLQFRRKETVQVRTRQPVQFRTRWPLQRSRRVRWTDRRTHFTASPCVRCCTYRCQERWLQRLKALEMASSNRGALQLAIRRSPVSTAENKGAINFATTLSGCPRSSTAIDDFIIIYLRFA
jgi:hypothetical protein